MNYGIIKVASCSPHLVVADCGYNRKKIVEEAKALSVKGVEIAVFPELSITGSCCGDLFLQSSLQKKAVSVLEEIASQTAELNMVIFVGLPFVQPDGLFNVTAAVFNGDILALIPKVNVGVAANGSGVRVFNSGDLSMETRFVSFGKFENVPFGTNILLNETFNSNISIACETGGDLFSPIPPSTYHTAAGATVIINPFALPEEVGQADFYRTMVKAQSARTISAYISAGASYYESTQDCVYGGRKFIAENGHLLVENNAFDNYSLISDIDVDAIFQERLRNNFGKNSSFVKNQYVAVEFEFDSVVDYSKFSLDRVVEPHPFIPELEEERDSRCKEVVEIQARGLARRLKHIHCESAVVGLSGGLDSTLALLVTCRAFDILGLGHEGITAITMPCFGTTDRTYNNACQLAEECGATLKEVRIADSVIQHFKDIGQEQSCHDVTYENSQARERTQVLMDYANKVNAIVIGTGDLSELALGWCTYNGDHMSMYGVNSSVPKTLVRYLVSWFAEEMDSNVLRDILDTPVSPELLPPTEGNISQVTEDLVGPYELHDFYLYYILRYGFEPGKIIYLAEHSGLEKKYNHETMVKWLKTFYRRFFTQQFKRSCMPDGPAVGSVSLSPRGAWKMPSDGCGELWIKEVEKL